MKERMGMMMMMMMTIKMASTMAQITEIMEDIIK